MARFNRPAKSRGKILGILLLLVGVSGAVQMVRGWKPSEQNAANVLQPKPSQSVAQETPSTPDPAKMSTEDNYREAIALFEQADRLINQATGSADLALGEEKLTQAKKHLDQLPVTQTTTDSYINYNGRVRYRDRTVYSDQFASLRSKVEQMQAQLFQEKQTKTLLLKAEQAMKTAKQKYQQAKTSADRSAALISWQAAIGQLEQIPDETWAGKTAQAKLKTYRQEFEQSSSLAKRIEHTSVIVQAAKQFAMQAAVMSQHPPHAADKWRQVENLWQEAINRLEEIPAQDPGYVNTQKLLAKYKTNLGVVHTRRQAEEASVADLEMAKQQIESWMANSSTVNSMYEYNRMASQLQGIINQLKKVKSGTTAYAEARKLLISAQKSLNQMQSSQ